MKPGSDESFIDRGACVLNFKKEKRDVVREGESGFNARYLIRVLGRKSK